MNITEAFPSQYLKAADLKKQTVRVIIDRVSMEDIGSDHKPVLYFKGKEKGLVLNKTNSNNIAYLYGTETDSWIGRPLELFPTIVDYQGRPVEAIRVRPASNGGGAPEQHQRPAPTQEPPPAQTADAGFYDSEVPF